MSVPKDIQAINQWLDLTYGHDLLRRPNYRVVWSVGQVEKRKGTFVDMYGSIIVREYFAVKEMPKYLYHPNWRERWILEVLDFTPNEELALDVAGHYEPLYVFYDENGRYIKPTLAAIQFFMTKLLLRKPWKTDAEKQREMDEMERGEHDQEAEFFYGCLDDAFGSDIASALRSKTGVVVPGVIHLPDGGTHMFNKGVTNASDNSQPSAV
jgi:hypothetical protein